MVVILWICPPSLSFYIGIDELEHLEDLRFAGYTDQEILEVMSLPVIPPKDVVFEFLGRCARCGLYDHLLPNCPGVCQDCQLLGLKCAACTNVTMLNLNPKAVDHSPLDPLSDTTLSGPLICYFRCMELGHFKRDCTNDVKCLECFGWGHMARKCPFKQ